MDAGLSTPFPERILCVSIHQPDRQEVSLQPSSRNQRNHDVVSHRQYKCATPYDSYNTPSTTFILYPLQHSCKCCWKCFCDGDEDELCEHEISCFQRKLVGTEEVNLHALLQWVCGCLFGILKGERAFLHKAEQQEYPFRGTSAEELKVQLCPLRGLLLGNLKYYFPTHVMKNLLASIDIFRKNAEVGEI